MVIHQDFPCQVRQRDGATSRSRGRKAVIIIIIIIIIRGWRRTQRASIQSVR
jgi:hypothetical protein